MMNSGRLRTHGRYVTLALLTLLAHPSWAAGKPVPDDTAIYVNDPALPGHPDLEITQDGPKMATSAQGSEIAYTATITGRCKGSDSTLIWKNNVVQLNEDKTFSISLPIVAQATNVELYKVDSQGSLKKQTISILIPKWQSFKEKANSNPPKSRFISGGLGVSRIQIVDSRVAPFSEFAFTAKASYSNLIFPPLWDMGASAYYTLFPFAANRSDTVRFLGVNLRMGYVAPFIKEPWRLGIQVGAYYTTMFVASQTFGFQHMAGPQIYPTLRRMFVKGDSVGGYFKFSPVSSGFSFESLSNNEMAGGVAYTRPRKNGHSMGVSFDLARLHVLVEDVRIISTSMSLSANYGF